MCWEWQGWKMAQIPLTLVPLSQGSMTAAWPIEYSRREALPVSENLPFQASSTFLSLEIDALRNETPSWKNK